MFHAASPVTYLRLALFTSTGSGTRSLLGLLRRCTAARPRTVAYSTRRSPSRILCSPKPSTSLCTASIVHIVAELGPPPCPHYAHRSPRHTPHPPTALRIGGSNASAADHSRVTRLVATVWTTRSQSEYCTALFPASFAILAATTHAPNLASPRQTPATAACHLPITLLTTLPACIPAISS